MYPEDRVLVAVMNHPDDLRIARDESWYRVPEKQAGRGAFFEYVAFYYTASFGQNKWSIHHYARNLGHELLTRRELLPQEPDHPRAGELYYKLQLGPLQQRLPPIPSLRWRRITFIYTTWDRFQAAEEINDLYAEGGEFVDRLYHALRESGLAPERCYPVRESGTEYIADLALPCRNGTVALSRSAPDGHMSVPGTPRLLPETVLEDTDAFLLSVQAEVGRLGGLRPVCPESGAC